MGRPGWSGGASLLGPLLLVLLRRDEADLFAVGEGVGRIRDYLLIGIEAAEDLDAGTIVAACRDADDMRMVVGIDSGDVKTVRLKDGRADRNGQRRRGTGDVEMDLGVTAGQQFAAPVVHINFSEQRACRGIDGV